LEQQTAVGSVVIFLMHFLTVNWQWNRQIFRHRDFSCSNSDCGDYNCKLSGSFRDFSTVLHYSHTTV